MYTRDIALWRFSILGSLVSARLEYGDHREFFAAASERLYEYPSGARLVRVSARTIDNWYFVGPNPREDRDV